MADLIDIELLPSMRCPALTVTANLKPEQALDVTSNPIVVRFDDSGASGLIDELDETLISDRTHEIVVHSFDCWRFHDFVRSGNVRVAAPPDSEDCAMPAT